MLQRLIQRPRVAKGKDVAFGLPTWPGDPALFDGQADGHLKARLDPGANDFAIALQSMTIAQKEQGTGSRDRKPDRCPRPKAAVIHVAAIFTACRRGNRLTA